MSLGIYLECPGCGEYRFSRNPTYNLGPMWRAAGLEWETLEGKGGEELGLAVRAAADRMRADPAKFKALNPPNGWGDYEGLLDVLDALGRACEAHPGLVLRLSP